MSAAIGLGCRAGASVEAIVARVSEARARAALTAVSLHTSIAVNNPALDAAAAALGLVLHRHDEDALAKAAAGVVSHSPRVAARFGVGSVAEAAALAGAGEGAILIERKFSADGVSCAVARGRA